MKNYMIEEMTCYINEEKQPRVRVRTIDEYSASDLGDYIIYKDMFLYDSEFKIWGDIRNPQDRLFTIDTSEQDFQNVMKLIDIAKEIKDKFLKIQSLLYSISEVEEMTIVTSYGVDFVLESIDKILKHTVNIRRMFPPLDDEDIIAIYVEDSLVSAQLTFTEFFTKILVFKSRFLNAVKSEEILEPVFGYSIFSRVFILEDCYVSASTNKVQKDFLESQVAKKSVAEALQEMIDSYLP